MLNKHPPQEAIRSMKNFESSAMKRFTDVGNILSCRLSKKRPSRSSLCQFSCANSGFSSGARHLSSPFSCTSHKEYSGFDNLNISEYRCQLVITLTSNLFTECFLSPERSRILHPQPATRPNTSSHSISYTLQELITDCKNNLA